MNIDLIPVGDDPPSNVNVVIEVPVGGEPVKYEFDKKSGALFVDRILHTPMRYPANYGFIPQTYCGARVASLTAARTGRHGIEGDKDPLDVCVLTQSAQRTVAQAP